MATYSVSSTTTTSITTSLSFSGTYPRVKYYLDGVYHGDALDPASPHSYTFGSLSSGTSYTLTAQLLNSDGTEAWKGSVTGTTDTPDTTNPTVNITSPSASSWHSGSVTIKANASDNTGGSGVDYVRFNNATLGIIDDSTSPYSAGYSLSTVSDGSGLTFYATAVDNAGNSSTSDSVKIYVDNTAPSLTINPLEATKTSVTTTWGSSDASSGVSSHRVYISAPNDNTTWAYNTVSSTTTSKTFTTDALGNAITAGNTYYSYVIAYDNAGNSTKSSVLSVVTPNRPDDWKWTTANDVNGHKVSGVDFSMLAKEWNDFTTRINAFRDYKSLTAYTFTSASAGVNFKSTYFNEARNAINEMVATMATVSSGEACYASYFNRLMDDLNSIA